MITDSDLDDICRKIVRMRDSQTNCIICGKRIINPVICHYFKRRHNGTRWHLDNIHLGCSECNSKEEAMHNYTTLHLENLINRIGINTYDKLRTLRLENVKYSPSDKKELYDKLKQILKNYEKE